MIAEFTDKQVGLYTRKWFALDTATAEVDRAPLAESFLAESQKIHELRANPLLLALMCEMYAGEHYIPTNLAQIYERCATMMFDSWDVQRGIAKAPQFLGRLRSSVQYLAWEMYNAEERGKALSRHRIVRILADHLMARTFDEDDALTAAEEGRR